jgi:transposase
MRATDNKTRENIIKAKQRNEKRETIAFWLNVSVSTVDKVWKRFKETGLFLPTPYTGRKDSIDAETDEKIRDAIKAKSDITLEELIEKLSLSLTPSGLSRKLDRMDLSYKKRRFSHQNKTAPMSSKSAKIGVKTNNQNLI